jgi:voltage-gated sodium channel
MEADLGLLASNGAPSSKAFDAELAQLAVPPGAREAFEAELRTGLAQDQRLQGRLQKGLNAEFDKYGINATVHKPSPKLEPAAYSVCEYCIVAFMILEMLLRICDQGKYYFYDAWCVFDFAVVFHGLADVALPYFVGRTPSLWALELLTFLRVMRILRVVRLLRVCQKLRAVTRAFMNAFVAMAYVSVVLGVFNFVCAVLLTSYIGGKAHMWSGDGQTEVEGWFGSVGRSMTTLFTIMTLSGWEHIAQVLTEVIPSLAVAVFFILYVMLCFFTVVGLLAGMVSDSFAAARHEDTGRRMRATEERRSAFAGALTTVFTSCDQSRQGCLNRFEYGSALETHPVLFQRMKMLDIRVTTDDFLQLFDRLGQESEADGYVKVEDLVEAMASLSGAAKASGVYDLKHLLLSLRREGGEQAEGLRQEVATRHQESQALAATAWQVTEVRTEVANLQASVVSIAKEVGLIGEQLQQVSHLGKKLSQVSSMDDKLAKVLLATERLEELERRGEAERQMQRETQEKAIASVQAQIDGMVLGAGPGSTSTEHASQKTEDELADAGAAATIPAIPASAGMGVPPPDPEATPRSQPEQRETSDGSTDGTAEATSAGMEPESAQEGEEGAVATEARSSTMTAETGVKDSALVHSEGKPRMPDLDLESVGGQVSEPEKTPQKEPEDDSTPLGGQFMDLGVDELCKKMLKSEGGDPAKNIST